MSSDESSTEKPAEGQKSSIPGIRMDNINIDELSVDKIKKIALANPIPAGKC